MGVGNRRLHPARLPAGRVIDAKTGPAGPLADAWEGADPAPLQYRDSELFEGERWGRIEAWAFVATAANQFLRLPVASSVPMRLMLSVSVGVVDVYFGDVNPASARLYHLRYGVGNAPWEIVLPEGRHTVTLACNGAACEASAVLMRYVEGGR